MIVYMTDNLSDSQTNPIAQNNFNQYELHHKQTIQDFLNNPNGYEILYNQGCYSWEEKNIKYFLQDLLDFYNKDKDILSLGTLYFLKDDLNASKTRITIFDGRQRAITIYLFLASIRGYLEEYCFEWNKKGWEFKTKFNECKKTIEKINQYLFKRSFDQDSREENDVKKGINIPNLKIVHSIDDILLKLILNGEIESLKICYYFDKDKETNICKNCEKDLKEKNKMEKHVLECPGHKNSDHEKIISIYNKYDIPIAHKMSDVSYYITHFLYDNFDEDFDNDDPSRLLEIFYVFEKCTINFGVYTVGKD